MTERFYLEVISARRRGPTAALLRSVLSVLATVYRAAICVRNALYDVGWFRSRHPGVPVISVGNLTTGGTGKTPMVAWLADWFTARGRRPVLLSRGYRSLHDAANDEKRVLEQLCPGVPHLQDPRRLAAARRAVKEHSPDVLILDDGFQHRRLARDVDIVLIDALNPWGYRRLLPRGLLREPPSSLRRASMVILTRIDQIDERALTALRNEAQAFCEAPVAEVVFRPQHLLSPDGRTISLNALAGKPVVAFCGIGNPDGFRRTLDAAEFPLDEARFRAFPDHHHYTPEDLRQIAAWAREQQATALLTTQKDLVKIEPSSLGGCPLWGVVIAAEFVRGGEHLETLLE